MTHNVKKDGAIKLSFSEKLQRYAFRSTTQIVVHVLASIVVALILYVSLRGRVSVSRTSFVTVTCTMSEAAGVLLAVTLAVATFYGLYLTNWRDKLTDKLAETCARMRRQMEISVRKYPEIPRHLAPLYEKSALYVPGKPIDKQEIDKIARSFLAWVKSQTDAEIIKMDAGDPATYDSFGIHLRDATICAREISHTLTLLFVVRRRMDTVEAFSPLIGGWVTVLILALIMAITGGTGILSEEIAFPLLLVPSWLLLVGGFALIKDVKATFGFLHIQEIAFDEALTELRQK